MDLSKTAFITDLDGTLLTTDKRLNSVDIVALRQYKESGGLFGIATGRPIQTTVRYLEALDCDLPLILYNGCIIYDGRKSETLYTCHLPNIAKEIFYDVRKKFPDISPEIFTFQGQYYFYMNDAERWHQSILEIPYVKLSDASDIVEPWCKMLFADETEIIDELAVYVEKFAGSGVHFVRSSPKFLEILPEGVSKGSALKRLIEIVGLSDRFIASAGDYDNDIEMLTSSDYGFCPSDSRECVKDIADFVLKADCNGGAVAEALDILRKL